MITCYDQLGRELRLQTYPKRIISVVPSQTELLFDLGLHEEVVGITKFCVRPDEWFRTKTRVGGTKTLNTDLIRLLQPDLILANKEENTKDQIEELSTNFAVWISDVNDLHTAFEMIRSVGKLTNTNQKASEICNTVKRAFDNIPNHLQPPLSPRKTAYLIWKDPYLTVGGDTYINAMLRACGLTNIFEHRSRYPEIKIEELQAGDGLDTRCELLLLSTEPYPFAQKHVQELQARLPNTKIILVDGEMFSWYGSRLLHAPAYLRKLLEDVRDSNRKD